MADLIPRNLHVNPPPMIEILPREHVLQAWEWWISCIHPRAALLDGNCCIYDQKRWDIDNPTELRWNDHGQITYISRLFLVSLLGDISETICMSLNEPSSPVRIPPPRLEEHYRNLIAGNPNPDNERDRFERFRYSLSESLAFWVQLSYLSQSVRGVDRTTFSISRPIFLPDDKGPDGLAVILQENNANIELRSVKSSITSPKALITSNSFKKNGIPTDGKLLDEFYKVAYESYGLGKLEDLLDKVCRVRNISTNYETRIGLLGTSKAYNAMVVADDRFASYPLFSGFDKVCCDATRCIATYVGANNWARFSDEVHHVVENILNDAGAI